MSHVLIVEDDQIVSQCLGAILDSQGITHDAAFNMGEAEHAVKQIEFDVILLDLMLPCVRGAETLKRMRPAAPRSPIVVVSGWIGFTNECDVEKLLELGACAVVSKADMTRESLKSALDVALLARRSMLSREAVTESVAAVREAAKKEP